MRQSQVLLGFLASTALLFGQGGLGSISGTVVDPSDAPIPGATVKVVQISTNSSRTTTTNDVGIFNLPSLPASRYEITIESGGFRPRTIPDMEVNAFQNISLGRVMLDIGSGPATVVDVTAEIPRIVTENAVRSDVIQAKQVTEMPLQGRNWSTLLKQIPGSVPRNVEGINGREAGYDGYADFRVNGKAQNQTQVNLDGGSNVDHGSDSKTTVTPSLEAIQEVAILTNNFQAEYGTRAGTVINIVTKSGTNEFHGTGWNYMRNEVLNARPWSQGFFGLPKPRYRFNYFGGNFAGPIKKDRLFFFYNYENLKQDTPTITNQIRVPTELERNGDFSETINTNGIRPTIYMPGSQASGTPVLVPNRIIPQSMIHPLGRAIMNIYPLPNLLNETNNNYLNEYARINRRHLNVMKVDWTIDQNTRAFVRFNYDHQHYRDMVTWAAGSNLPFTVTGWDRPDKAMTVNLTKAFSATLVSETLVNWQKDFVNAPLEVSGDPSKITKAGAGLESLPLALAVKTDILPAFSGTGYQDFQFNRFPWYAIAPEWQIAQTVSWTRGSHLIKIGGQFIRNQKDEINQAIEKGRFNFGVNTASEFDWGYSPANILGGAVSQFDQVSNPSRKLSRYRDLHFFIQDTWRATSKLTIDYGVRLYNIPSEHNYQHDLTLDAAFVASRWDPAKAPRYYVPAPNSPNRIIDPANPSVLLPASVAAALRYSLVPGSGDPMNGVVALGRDGFASAGIRDPRPILFSPRGGIAWQFLDRTVLRAGFGWSYNRPTIGQATGTFQNGLADQVDYRQTSFSTLANPAINRISPRTFGSIDESSNKVPTIYDWSISIQRELPFNMVLDLGYIGNVQRHQVLQFNINQVLPGTAWQPQFRDPRLAGNNFSGPVSASNPGPLPGTQAVDSNLMRPYQGFINLNHITNVGNNRYHSMQWSLSKRFSHGLTFNLMHTFGKLLSGTENVGPFFYNWKDYTGFMANNHRLNVWGFNYTYDVPKLSTKLGWDNPVARQMFDGWNIAHMINWYSGEPLTPTFGLQYASRDQGVPNLNATFTGSPDIAPRLVPTANANNGARTIDNWYNLSPFAVPNLPTDGTGSRNYLWGPGTFSNDINISKQFPIREKMGLELRASLFNPFNQVRRQVLNNGFTFKMRGATAAEGAYLFNSPDQLVTNLVNRLPTANETEKYNQYRLGVGHSNVTDVLANRIIEIGLRLRF